MTRCIVLATVLALSGIGGANAGGPYDGTYHGQLTADGMNAMSCAKSAPVQMTVTDNKLELPPFQQCDHHGDRGTRRLVQRFGPE